MIKITAPIHDPDDCAALIDAGAQEFYCGVVSPDNLDFRNTNLKGAHLPDMDSLKRLVDNASRRETPVYLCINSYQSQKGFSLQIERASKAIECGVSGLIVADFSIIPEIRRLSAKTKIILSTAASCANSSAAAFYAELGVDRVILERQLTIAEISAVAAAAASQRIEAEVFVRPGNGMHINGFCRIHGIEGESSTQPGGVPSRFWMCRRKIRFLSPDKPGGGPGPVLDVENGLTGLKWGCGICALYYLTRCDIAAVKLGGREIPAVWILRNIKFVREYLERIQSGRVNYENFTTVGADLHAAIFKRPCSDGECFYYEVRNASRSKRQA